MAGLIISIVGLSLFVILTSVYCFKQKEIGIIILGVIIILTDVFIISLIIIDLFDVCAAFQEITVKVISKDCIKSIISEQITDQDITDSFKTYYIKIDSGEKIILSEKEWDKVTNEYTYVPIEDEYIEEE